MTPLEKVLLRAINILRERGQGSSEYLEALLKIARTRAYGSNTSSCGICGGNHRSRDCTVSN